MNGRPSLTQLAGDLDFLLGSSMPHHEQELVKYRATFHRNMDAMFSQILYTARSIYKTKEQINGLPLKVAILFPDVMPNDCEWIGKVLLRNMFELGFLAPSNALILTNRPNIRSMLGNDLVQCSRIIDVNLTEYDFILVNSGLLYIGITLESLFGITFRKSIFCTTCTSISSAKADSLFSNIGYIVPFYPSTGLTVNPGKDKGVAWTNEDVTPGFVLPDMDRLKSCLVQYCREHGKEEGEISDLLQRVLPTSLVDEIEFWKKETRNCHYKLN